MLPAAAKISDICVVGRGVAVDPSILGHETRQMKLVNKDLRVIVDPTAALITDQHKADDVRHESSRPIGSTMKGVGPSMADRALRKNPLVQSVYKNEENDYLAPQMSGVFIGDPTKILHRHDTDLLMCGAHGVMLDPHHGHYPFVTSSPCLPSYVSSGLGIDARSVDMVIGVIKPYTTRVGEGYLNGPMGVDIKDEVGSVTGRKRRIAALDLPMLRYAHSVCGFDGFVLTRMDVLETTDVIFKYSGGDPTNFGDYINWDCPSIPISVEKLPQVIEQETGIPVLAKSVGPYRENTIDMGLLSKLDAIRG